MRRMIPRFGVGIALMGPTWAARPQTASDSGPSTAQYRAVLDRYCVTCHNQRLKTAGLLLDKIDVDDVPPGSETREKVVRKLRTQAMPPSAPPRPDRATYDSLAGYLETELDRAAAARPNPGRLAVHRLKRAEYTNAIRDLFSIDISAKRSIPLLTPDTGLTTSGMY